MKEGEKAREKYGKCPKKCLKTKRKRGNILFRGMFNTISVCLQAAGNKFLAPGERGPETKRR